MTLLACRLPLLILILLLPNRSLGCSIPVFRYALERWPPARYEVVVFHRDTLSQETLDLLSQFAQPGKGGNVTVTCIDLGGQIDKAYQRLREKNESKTLPWLVVRFPDSDDKMNILWAGPLTETSVAPLLDSPVRRKVAEHLTQGDSAVFLLLTGGRPDADAAAEILLRRELARLEQQIKLPEQSKEGPQLTFNVPLKVSFPLLVLSRENAAERMLVQMLLRGDEDLTSVAGPIVFPIFGRGRMLCSFHGDELKANRLEEVARFLCGACSCRVKELNPGVDLLMADGWDDRLATAGTVEKSPAPQAEPTSPFPKRTPTTAPRAREASAPDGPPGLRDRTDRTGLWIAIAVAAGLVLATGIWAVRTMQSVKLT